MIHRSQGLTIQSLAFNPTHIRTHGLVYTALSHESKTLINLYLLEPIVHEHIKVNKLLTLEVQKLHKEQQWSCIQK